MSFRTNLGAQLIATYINLIFYTLEAVLAHHYFRRSGRSATDRKTLKYAVIFNIILDTLCTIAVCGLIYAYTVTFWGKPSAIGRSREYWPVVVIIVMTGIVTFVVQCFMIHRYWLITSHHVICLTIMVLMLASLVGTCLSAVDTLKESAQRRHRRIPFVVLGFGGAAITDLWITVLLVWQLHKVGSGIRETSSLVRRVSIIAIQTGLITTILACIAVITFVAAPTSQVSDAVLFTIGRVYTCTMLFTLNTRGRVIRDARVDHNTTSSTKTGGAKLRFPSPAPSPHSPHPTPPMIPLDQINPPGESQV